MEEIDGNSTPSSATLSSASAPLSQTSTEQSCRCIRSKSDPAWAYISESRSNDGKKCLFLIFVLMW